jgi:hypothetical protein
VGVPVKVIEARGVGAVAVGYPFSRTPTRHRVQLAGTPPVWAMCAIDALGIPQMTGPLG